MHRQVQGLFYLQLFALGGMLLAGSGCSFVKVPQGWVFSTGWCLEFHRMPFYVCSERPCQTVCDAPCEATCNTPCSSTCNSTCNTPNNAGRAAPANEADQPNLAPQQVAPAPSLQKIEGDKPETDKPTACNSPGCNSPGFLSLLNRHGRLGVCATCGKLGRINSKEPQPADQSTMPVVAKFHPVPAAPVFCPQPNSTKPVDYQTPAAKTKSSPVKKGTVPAKPNINIPSKPAQEVIPPPPPSVQNLRTERAPREFELPPEPPDWVFTNPEKRTPPATETQSQRKPSDPPVQR
jgi:hypothetical protein